ncbi:MAG: thioesterase family protein, partial [Actinomycetota bacterium]
SPQSPLPPDQAEARARLGAAYRRLGHAIAGHHIDVATADDATAGLDRLLGTISTGERRDRVTERPTGDWGPAPVDGEQMYSFDERPVSGRSAPLGFDVAVFRDGDDAVGHIALGRAHEGAPSRSHGGIVSALFDDLFGFVLTIEQQPAFTGELTVRYEAPTPIEVPLECRTRLVERDGRKLHMAGELTDTTTGVVTATARAIMIAIDAEAFRRV